MAKNEPPENETGGNQKVKINGLELVGADPGASFCLAPTQELYAGKLPEVCR